MIYLPLTGVSDKEGRSSQWKSKDSSFTRIRRRHETSDFASWVCLLFKMVAQSMEMEEERKRFDLVVVVVLFWMDPRSGVVP
jgi:hypothetical protein